MKSSDSLDGDLFAEERTADTHLELLFEQYKLFVNTSEALAQRRQGVNTFFLSVNSLLLAAGGIVARDGSSSGFGGPGWLVLIVLSLTGTGLCLVWRRLIHSFSQLAAGKFRVILALERRLPAKLFSAEWTALGSGTDPTIYKPFTRTESMTPMAFLLLHVTLLPLGLVLSSIGPSLCP